MLYKNASIFLDGRFQPGAFRVEDGRFSEILDSVPAEDGLDLGGAKVLMISEITAKLSNLHVGDTIPFSQFALPDDTISFIKYSEHQNNPRIGDFFLDTAYSEPEDYTVVGIYRLPMAWSEGTYAFTTNTVFLPRSAQIADAYPKLEPYREPEVLHRDGETVTFENGDVGMIVSS